MYRAYFSFKASLAQITSLIDFEIYVWVLIRDCIGDKFYDNNVVYYYNMLDKDLIKCGIFPKINESYS